LTVFEKWAVVLVMGGLIWVVTRMLESHVQSALDYDPLKNVKPFPEGESDNAGTDSP
jgi:hypothetical protein